ncbi:MATE family efflux transporter [Sphingopyxis lindanitolerans]|uniref:Multidrug-efflux transporter n=1 Tax=Sphingopyxis lindanitolerans TaxID=2054227 RepID=A0A2S8B251_9SPHN|nr:MATE family efflux transporter [Sphingopyxis lindanitolerans]PQM26485.1 MATE family efflux transporter [Sphingopyxis lindanitolerans]
MLEQAHPLTAAPPQTFRAEFRATLALALPLAAANLLQMLVHAVDVIFVARLGDTALAASSLGVAIFGLLLWTGTGLVGAAAPLIAAELGRRNHSVREVRRTVRMALWLSLLVSLAFMGVCAAGGPIMHATGQDPILSERAAGFLLILMWGMFPMIAASVLRIFVSALGRPTIATAITFFALFVNAFGNWVLVFGHLGLPALGLHGSALSSVMTSTAMLVAYVVVIQTDRRLRRYHLFGNWWRSEWSRFAEMLRIGTPIGLTILAEAGLFTGAAFLMGRIGEAQLAGHTIALQIAALAFQIPFGVAQAATIRVGLAYGARDRRGIALAGRASLGLGVGFMGFTALLIWLFPGLVLSIYVDVNEAKNAALVGFAMQFLVVAAAFQLFDGAQTVAAGVLRGLQDTRIPMLIAVCGYWIAGYGTAIYLGFWTPLSGVGVWIGLAVGLVVVAAMLLTRWRLRARLGLLPA